MTKLRATFSGVALLALASCTPPQPFIADLEQDKVIVQVVGDQLQVAGSEAQRGCQMHGRVASAPISHQCVDQYCTTRQVLYACQEAAQYEYPAATFGN